MKVKAYGKLNLTLFITGNRGRLHLIDSVMTTVSVFDELTVEPADRISVSCDDKSIVSGNNSAFKAAELVERVCGLKLAVAIKKGIPVGGGLGGSSADAAAVLWCAARLTNGKYDFLKPAPLIGSDVRFMAAGGAARVRGTGEEISPFACNARFCAQIVDCGPVATPACYEAYDRLGGSGTAGCNDALIRLLEAGKIPEEKFLANDLLPAAVSLNARVAEGVELARSAGFGAHLTGSGGCLFVLGESKQLQELYSRSGFSCRTVSYVPFGVELQTE